MLTYKHSEKGANFDHSWRENLGTLVDQTSLSLPASSSTLIHDKPLDHEKLVYGFIPSLSPFVQNQPPDASPVLVGSAYSTRIFVPNHEIPDLPIRNSWRPHIPHIIDLIVSTVPRDETNPNCIIILRRFKAVMEGITSPNCPSGGGVGLPAYAPHRIATENMVLARLDGETGTCLTLTGNSIAGYKLHYLAVAICYIRSRRIPPVLERLGTWRS
ncbi:hypothetical protein BS47DRAFT_1400569 [Hydnum rufescens UP504]|uniref:Uncharacterized protein n=1 Tax=Hydnum rufescens UP504 TaxID=1448309 RepID=A0A9P6AGF0_9AGAM|nr:hypothetical protein BS47DRAFT_1400569 [Hydnum rufescens UP504]